MGILDFLTGLLGNPEESQIGRQAGWQENEFREAVEEVVHLVHPKVRWTSNYRKKLRPAIERTLEYADELVKNIPGPVEINQDSWGKDSLTRALFVSVDEYRDFFRHNAELERFFQTTRVEQCYALLTMTREEKRIFGVELEDGIIKRDVLQVAVHFYEHRIVAPMASEKESRKALALHALSLLATHSLEEILSLKVWEEELEKQKNLMQVKVKIRQANERGIASLLSGTHNRDPQVAEAKAFLAEVDQKLSTFKAELNSPEDYLKRVANMLGNPQDYLIAESLRLRLSNMGIKISESSSATGHDVHLAELRVKEGPKRAAVLIRYSGG